MSHIRTLTRYKAWADDLLLRTVSSIPGQVLAAPRPIIFGSLIRTLNHAYTMDTVWRCHLRGERHGLTTRNPDHCPDIEQLAESQRRINGWYIDYVNSATENALAESVGFEFIGGGAGCMTRQEILLHVVNHATYHRGHVADMLYQLNVPPPTTDLPVFLRQQQLTESTVQNSSHE